MKVWINLSKSPFKFYINGVTYFFATELHLNNYKKKYLENRKEIAQKLTKRYHFNIYNSIIADIYLYTMIENRGFYIIIDGVGEIICPEEIKLDGDRLMKLDLLGQ